MLRSLAWVFFTKYREVDASATPQSELSPRIDEFDFSALQSFLTPNEQFFVRNHFAEPRLEAQNWRLKISGDVEAPFAITQRELLQLPNKTLAATLECAGNGVGGGGVSTAEWTGIPLESVLRRARLRFGVRQIRFIGADEGVEDPKAGAVSFARSLSVEKALDPDTLLVFQVNGQPLPVAHGFPLRVIAPGLYAMNSVKWLVRIEALRETDGSYFMTQRYMATRLATVGSVQHPVERMQVKSQIARPRQGETIPRGQYTIHGAAWAGGRVAFVEVSVDGGNQWQRAILDGTPQPYCWVLWKFQWRISRPGMHTVMVRAFDEKGRFQTPARDARRVDEYELNTYHMVRCVVK